MQAIAWKAQKRLCARFRHLIDRGLMRVKISTAIARELSGFMWAIAREVMNQQRSLPGNGVVATSTQMTNSN